MIHQNQIEKFEHLPKREKIGFDRITKSWYEEDFQKIRKEVRDKCVPDTTLWSEFHTCLLRFDRIKGYQLYYPSKNKIKENIYLKELGCALDTFLLNRNLQMIQFVTNLPQSYLYK